MTDIKTKIEKIVDDYKKVFGNEYHLFSVGLRRKKGNQKTSTGRISGGLSVERVLHDVPETLYSIFKLQLDDVGFKYYISKEGARWFARRFPEFRIVKKV